MEFTFFSRDEVSYQVCKVRPWEVRNELLLPELGNGLSYHANVLLWHSVALVLGKDTLESVLSRLRRFSGHFPVCPSSEMSVALEVTLNLH